MKSIPHKQDAFLFVVTKANKKPGNKYPAIFVKDV